MEMSQLEIFAENSGEMINSGFPCFDFFISISRNEGFPCMALKKASFTAKIPARCSGVNGCNSEGWKYLAKVS